MPHATLKDCIVHEDDASLGPHAEANFIRGDVFHSPDEQFLRRWLLGLLEKDLDRLIEQKAQTESRIEDVLSRMELLFVNR